MIVEAELRQSETVAMTAVAFDTLNFARNLREKAKLSAEQAEGLADAIAEALQGDLFTKADLRAELAETHAEIVPWVAGLIGFQTPAIIGPSSPSQKLFTDGPCRRIRLTCA